MAQNSQYANDLAEIMQALAYDAVDMKPRMFCIYGIVDHADHSVLGWGLEFTEDNLCIYLEPPSHAMHLANSAEQLMTVFRLMGDVRLVWLDEQPDEEVHALLVNDEGVTEIGADGFPLEESGSGC
jgi:hypothetical protein